MELRLLVDTLRSSASPLLSTLAPLSHPSWLPTTAPRDSRILANKLPKQSRRPFHLASQRRDRSSASAAVDFDFLEDIPRPNRSQPSPPPPSLSSPRKNASSNQIDDLLNSTFNVGRRKPYTPPTESPASAIEAGYKASEYYDLRDKGARFPGSLAQSMNFPNQPRSSDSSSPGSAAIDDYRAQRRMAIGEARRAKRTIRSCPSVGRTVEIDKERDVDFGRALVRLEVQCAQNKIKTDSRKQRFHERPGMKRKRLKSERWRQLFKESFRATVGRVKEMRRKGW